MNLKSINSFIFRLSILMLAFVSLSGEPLHAQYNVGAFWKGGCPLTGLLASYSFNAGSGTTAVDSSGNGNTIALTNTSWTTGHTGQALSFNGTTSKGLSGTSASLALTTSYTSMHWVYPTSDPNDGNEHVTADIEYAGDNFPITMEVYSYSGCTGCTACFYQKTASVFPGVSYATKLRLNTWSHVACSYDGAHQKMYINGVLVSSVAQTGAIISSPTANFVNVGHSVEDNGDFFYGNVDDVRFYNTTLTASQIFSCMNSAVTP